MTFAVAMSRSLGDWVVKGVIPDPTVDVVDIDELIATAQEKFTQECIAQQAADQGPEAACRQGEDNASSRFDASEVNILAISATDGMLDYLPLEHIAYVLAASMFVQENPHPFTAAEYLILTAAEHWQQEYQGHYRDDIAVAAVKVLRRRPNHQHHQQANDNHNNDKDQDHAKKPTITKDKDESSPTSRKIKKSSDAKEADQNTQGEEL